MSSLNCDHNDTSASETETASVEKLEIQRLREELDSVHRQNFRFAADVARGYSRERDQTRIITKTNDQLARSAKLATLGTMLAGIAHDVNNVIMPIVGFTELLQSTPDLPAKGKALAARIHHSVDRASAMLTTLKNFGADFGADRTAIDIASVVNTSVPLLEYSMARSGVRIEVFVDKGLPKVLANPSQLDQVLVNLLINAQHSMEPNGGVINIHVRQIDNGIKMSVCDCGSGIPKELVDRIFDPFFTTKEKGKGTGLGLFICHQIIDAHGGTIDVESGAGKGTSFHIALPAHAEKPIQAAKPASNSEKATGL